MNISDFSTHAVFEGVENKARMQRATAKTASFVHAIPGTEQPPAVMDIAARILREHYSEISLAAVKGPSRLSDLVAARRHVWTAVHEERPDLSIATIARMFKRDHSTVLTGIRRFKAQESAAQAAEKVFQREAVS